MTEPRRPASGMTATRGIVMSALLAGATAVLLSKLFPENREVAIGSVVAGAALLFLLPRPIDVRSAAYAFFVPTSMSYGAVTEHYLLMAAGIAMGVAFLIEKTAGRRDPSAQS